MRAREQLFLWHGRLPVGHMSVIAGQPGTGKSTLGYRIAADCDVPTLFVTTEEVDETVWLPRLLAAGVDPEKAWHHPEVMFTRNPMDLDYLADLIERHGIKLVVVDPIQNHLGASVSHDIAVRNLIKPYLGLMQQHKVALLLEAHVLRDISPSSDPLLAVPAGLRGESKAVYLFGKDPTLGAGPDFRVLATAKYNFGEWPASRRLEFATGNISVIRAQGGGRVTNEFATWSDRGEVRISAKMLLITLSPETKERKSDRVGQELIAFLRQGKDGRRQPVSAVKKMVEALDPPTSWRTAQRVCKEMDIEVLDDPKNKLRKWWSLPDAILAVYEEMTEASDEIEFKEIDIDVPDTLPEDWEDV